MTIYLACDHAGFELKNQIKEKLKQLNLVDLSEKFRQGDDYPLVAFDLVSKMQNDDFAIALCGTGEGICMALNRYKKIRAATVNSLKIAKIVRQHNHANVICLPARSINIEKAIRLIEIFLKTKPSFDQRHIRRVEELSQKGES
jgi:ribose 5-phosphate isomerase B